jgi:hypothetical protein
LKKIDIQDIINDIVESKLDNKFFKGDSLEDYIIKSTSKEMFAWFENNIEKEDIIDCIKQVMIEKLKDFSIDELVMLYNKIK